MSYLARSVFQARTRFQPAGRAYPTLNIARGHGCHAFRIAQTPTPILTAINRRYVTTEAGDDKSGHINAGKNEGIFFFYSMLSSSILGNEAAMFSNRALTAHRCLSPETQQFIHDLCPSQS